MNGELFSKLKRFFPVSGAIYLHFWQICQNEMSLWCLIQCYQLSLSFWMYLVVRCCNYHSQIKHISFPTSFLRQYYYICSGHHEVYIIQPCWLPGYVRKALAYTAWKASKYGVFSGPYFSAFGLNTEIYFVNFRILSECGVNLRIQSEWVKIRTRKNSVFGNFSRSVIVNATFMTIYITC